MFQFPARRLRIVGGVGLLSMALLSGAAEAAAPQITGVPATSATVGQAYGFKPTATDADGNTLTFSVVNLPGWASFSSTTGELRGTPFAEDARVWSGIVISVSDGTTTVSMPTYALTVKPNANKSPIITGTPATAAKVGVAYSFQPTASDPEGATLTFSIRNRPSWATIDTVTGRLYGTPTAVAMTSGITIVASDGVTSASLQPAFSITVAPAAVNSAPTISGSPSTNAQVGVAYSFRPTAVDANGDPLTFSIVNRPSWATLNTATGQLSGTPTAVSLTSNVLISVTDGKATTSLAAFTIVVSPAPSTGTALLSWTPPTLNTDGTVLTNLAGYRIRYGKTGAALSSLTTVNSAGIASYVVGGLSPGVWYFALSAYTSTGVESGSSQVVAFTVL